jgi:hypothetical protein
MANGGNPFSGWTFTRIIVLIVVCAAIIAVMYVGLNAMGIAIPPWVIAIFWILCIAVVVILAIKFLAGFLCLLFLFLAAGGARADAVDACVRLISHGGSATCVGYAGGKSYLLSCGHCFESAADKRKPIKIDVPEPSIATPVPFRIEGRVEQIGAEKRVGTRLLAVEFSDVADQDLSLFEVGAALPYMTPVAPLGFRSAGNFLSCGYDAMRMGGVGKPQVYPAHFLQEQGGFTVTREPPDHGRSGGPLIDAQYGYVCGVCSSYTMTGFRGRRDKGRYVSLSAIHSFLQRKGFGWLIDASAPGQVGEMIAQQQTPQQIGQRQSGFRGLWQYGTSNTREVFDRALRQRQPLLVRLRDGRTAECTDIGAQSIDLIAAGQSYRLSLNDFGTVWTGESWIQVNAEDGPQHAPVTPQHQQPIAQAPAPRYIAPQQATPLGLPWQLPGKS